MCEPPETVLTSVNSSSVEDLREPIPGLFTALTSSDEASNEMWTVVRYPAHESLLHHKNFGVKVDLGKHIFLLLSWCVVFCGRYGSLVAWFIGQTFVLTLAPLKLCFSLTSIGCDAGFDHTKGSNSVWMRSNPSRSSYTQILPFHPQFTTPSSPCEEQILPYLLAVGQLDHDRIFMPDMQINNGNVHGYLYITELIYSTEQRNESLEIQQTFNLIGKGHYTSNK